jgi:Restriction endonuclease
MSDSPSINELIRKTVRTADSNDVEECLRAMSYREREIFKLRIGFPDSYRYTIKEISRIFKLTPERTLAIFRRARDKFLAMIDHFEPETEISPIFVASVLEQSRQLTPFMMSYLKDHPGELPLLPWQIVEQLIGEFFAGWGYKDVRLVGRDRRTAADVFAMQKIEPDGTEIRVFVEVKRWRDRVGVQVVNEVYGAFIGEQPTFGWTMAMVVSMSGFTDIKRTTPGELRMKGVLLKDGNDVHNWLRDYRFNKGGLWLPKPQTSILSR